MNENIETAPAGSSPGNLFFVVLRHKQKITLMTLIGLMAAVGFYFTNQPLYHSETRIFIRYVVDNRPLNPSDNHSRVNAAISPIRNNVMDAEMEILTSYDLAAKVATNIGPEKILAGLGGGSGPAAAARALKSHLKAECMWESSVIHVTFSHPDAALVQPVLSKIIADYLEKHWQARGSPISEESLLTNHLKQVQMELAQTEDQLRLARTNAAEARVSDLERKKEIQEGTYRWLTTLLDQSRLDEQLGPNRIPNISLIQNPTPPYKDFGQLYKTIGLLVFGSLLAGLAWAGLIEFFRRRQVT